ncbi:hypothetical protein CFH99_15435 [Nocardioides aromaticivorans]|uniref:Uncharacterized protein n=1 Tax=Nocardioides aromaticivorans TaxID=200618 RepID=A0ABX7PM15_9ACTN|nr:hypothetical protein [Nocardioides aromaticivorans]QSR27021.1 hypothetical protein CFH99_15435 [Nocardioides aromaticivorans]
MTEKLKTLMDRAADLDFDAVDLAAIVESGDRAVRRRRTSAVGGVAALALVAGGVAVALGGGDAAKDRAPVAGPITPEVSWVVGDTLHTPSASYDLGRKAEAYVRTAVGYAFLADDGGVFSLIDGRVARIGGGAGGESQLVGDENGSLVGWVDRSGDVPAYVTVDMATGVARRHDDHLDASMAGGEPPKLAWFFAIDDGTAYWMDVRGDVATDLATGESRVIATGKDLQWIGDVTAGLRVGLVERDGGADVGTDLRDRDGRVVLPADEDRFYGVVSPDGRWVTTADGSVVEVASGTEHPIAGADRADTLFAYEWLDDDTVVALVERGDGVELETCEVPEGACSPVTTIERTEKLVLPVGGYVTEMLATGAEVSATETGGAPATD